MMEAYDVDTEAWLAERERATSEYPAEMKEWELSHPRPQLSEYMKLQGRF
jgi:hypothetical protein